jgi:hypothetical protein
MTATNREASSQQFKFRHLPPQYAIVRLPPDIPVPDWAAKGEFTSLTRTADELSVVCPTENLPKEIDAGLRWICLKLEGPFPFSQTGVLLSFIEPLANQGIPIFADFDFRDGLCSGRGGIHRPRSQCCAGRWTRTLAAMNPAARSLNRKCTPHG